MLNNVLNILYTVIIKNNLFKILATSAVAGLALFGSAEKANAQETVTNKPIYVTTTVSTAGVDADTNRPGIQRKIDWAVQNISGLDGINDAVWRYTIQENITERGVYAVTNSGATLWSTHFDSPNNSFSWLADQVGNSPIRPSITKTFSALIDETNFLGTINVNSYGTSNNGNTDSCQVGVPARPFQEKIYIDTSSDSTKKVYWFSQTNNLGRKFVVDRQTNLLDSAWTPVLTTNHSITSTKYEFNITNSYTKVFLRIKETD